MSARSSGCDTDCNSMVISASRSVTSIKQRCVGAIDIVGNAVGATVGRPVVGLADGENVGLVVGEKVG